MIALNAALEFWLNDRSQENRDRLVAQYTYLCVRGARRFYRGGTDRADLEQIAAIGLLKACDRYDERLETPFEAFAWLFIVGELMHYVRDNERLVRAPRRLRALERRALKAHEALAFELGREPSMTELGRRLGIGGSQVAELMRYRAQQLPESLEDLEAHRSAPVYTLEERENQLVLEAALERLTETERTIIQALYTKGFSQFELADRLGFSRRHISRLHRGALRKMQPVWVSKSA